MSVSETTLVNYIEDYREEYKFRKRHFIYSGAVLLGGGAVFLLAAWMLNNGVVGLNFGVGCNYAAAAAAGGLVTAVAIGSVYFHYKLKHPEKLDNASAKKFLKALIEDPLVQDLFSGEKTKKWTRDHFEHMIERHFSEDQWQAMMGYINEQFFVKVGKDYKAPQMKQVFGTFFRANPLRFVNNYYAMKENKKFNDKAIQFLEPYLAEAIRTLPTNAAGQDAICTITAKKKNCHHLIQTLEYNIQNKIPQTKATIDRLLNSVQFAIYYCELEAEKLISTQSASVIDFYLYQKLERISVKDWQRLMFKVGNTYFHPLVPVKEDKVKFALIDMMLDTDTQKFADNFIEIFDCLGDRFRLEVLKHLHEKIGEVATSALLNRLDYKQWHDLMISVDNCYYKKECNLDHSTKSSVINFMIDADRNKFLKAYISGRSTLCDKLCTLVDMNLKNMVDGHTYTLDVIETYLTHKEALPKEILDVLSPDTIFGNIGIPKPELKNWPRLIRALEKSSASPEIVETILTNILNRDQTLDCHLPYIEVYLSVRSELSTERRRWFETELQKKKNLKISENGIKIYYQVKETLPANFFITPGAVKEALRALHNWSGIISDFDPEQAKISGIRTPEALLEEMNAMNKQKFKVCYGTYATNEEDKVYDEAKFKMSKACTHRIETKFIYASPRKV